MPINSKLIVKNTVYLYIRMILILLVTLYMSRVLLDRLGATDYGLYYVVYGVIGLVSFLNGTLSTSTSRFITFELGSGDANSVKRIFNTTLVTHLFLAAFILLIGETIGLWYVHHIMVVPEGRLTAALIVYQLSIVSTITTIIQVPFTAEVIAHEKMNVFAFIGIFEAFSKLGVVFLLSIGSSDLLILYASLTVIVSIVVLLMYVLYCRRSFDEIIFSFELDRFSLQKIISFSGWNILANVCNTVMNQGVIMLFNLFFTPVVVAAQAIANQIYNALSQLAWNIRSAVNPQIIKLFAEKQFEESRKLTLASAEFILYLTMLFCVPCIHVMPRLMDIWLVEVPDYTVAFARLLLLQLIFDNYNASFYAPMLAANRIAFNSIAGLFVCIIQFVLLYLIFNLGFDAIWARYVGIAGVICFSLFIKPFILCRYIDYPWREMLQTLWKGIKIMLLVGTVNVVLFFSIPQASFVRSIALGALSFTSVIILSLITMGTNYRNVIKGIVIEKIKK